MIEALLFLILIACVVIVINTAKPDTSYSYVPPERPSKSQQEEHAKEHAAFILDVFKIQWAAHAFRTTPTAAQQQKAKDCERRARIELMRGGYSCGEAVVALEAAKLKATKDANMKRAAGRDVSLRPQPF